MIVGLYKGFSTYQYEYNKSLKLLDVELVKRDLLNHIFTPLDSRVGMCQFGTRIPDLLFQPLDSETLEIVETDLQYVYEYDPRVQLLELTITPLYDQNAIIASAILNYIELNFTNSFDLRLDFER